MMVLAQVTAARRILADRVAAGVAPDLVQQAVKQAAGRVLAPRAELARITRSGRSTAGRVR